MFAPAIDRYRMTYADWCRLPDDGRLYEILEGELYVSPPPSIDHQRAVRNLAFRLAEYLRRTGAGEVLFAPTGVKLSEDDVPEPDVVLVLREHAGRIGKQAIEGAPDLVVEILSPGTARRDVSTKRAIYQRHGVPEYWIVDPEGRAIEVLVLRAGRYERTGLYSTGETLRSPLLAGFEMEVAEVFSA